MPAPAWLTQIPVAHRGLHHLEKTGIPENSIAAFAAAIDKGYAIELDVRLSRDGIAMVFHDAKLDRLTGREGLADQLTAAELGALPLLGTSERPPAFRQVLNFVDGRAPLVVEIKNYGDAPVGPLEQAVARDLADYAGPFALQSFSPGVVDWLRRNLPDAVRGQIATVPEEMKSLDDAQRAALKQALDAGFGDPHFIAFDVTHLPQPLTERARARGLPVLTWTVRSPEVWARAKAHADNPIFEFWLP
ncbi:MAG: glycerophosphodiester phosphodiesterase [Alphaproteobacteria bacterium]|nr:glycerophosphodiester phosphodiesterase [Alphaproteobacteria bacterium]